MKNDSTKLIESWFAERNDDGEFVRDMRCVPYSVIGPKSTVKRIIFTTKPTIVSTAIDKSKVPEKFGMVGRYGLPCETDLHWINDVIGPRSLMFLGDMDPPDLMIFAWLRACVRPKQIEHLGVNETFLKALRLPSIKSLSIPSSRSEQQSLDLLKKVFPDLCEVIGNKCARMLNEGFKIELDAIVSAKKTAAPILRSAIPR